jgi:formylglycine-generating enzyme required for sulfatase activity
LLRGDGYEPGWNTGWNVALPTTKSAWDASVTCNATYATWTPVAGTNERRPINCSSWYDAAAFFIWDGGFLPSEAEWNYAAAGGAEQRTYPWSAAYPPGSSLLDGTFAVYCDAGGTSCIWSAENLGSRPLGVGRYGQFDLASSVNEWVLDWGSSDLYGDTDCVDYAYTTTTSFTHRMHRGGTTWDNRYGLQVGSRSDGGNPGGHGYGQGVRCARTVP